MADDEWTHADTIIHVNEWSAATAEQKAAAFLDLLATACALSETRQNPVLIDTLRVIAAKRGTS